jgi:hypothetical protein
MQHRTLLVSMQSATATPSCPIKTNDRSPCLQWSAAMIIEVFCCTTRPDCTKLSLAFVLSRIAYGTSAFGENNHGESRPAK